MAYDARIPADAAYLQGLGRATYNFAYLEWIVVCTIVRLSPDGFGSVPKRAPSRRISSALAKAIANTSPPLDDGLRRRLVKFEQNFRVAIDSRNKLIHAHPYTASDGALQLGGGGGLEWPIEAIYEAAKLFEDIAIEGSDIFHSDLATARP
jgi:hypothetical protein